MFDAAHALLGSTPRVRHAGDTDWFNLWTPEPGLLVTQAFGHLHGICADAILSVLNDWKVLRTPLVQFHDWYHVSSYDVRCQAELTEWHVRHVRSIKRLDIAVSSGFVRMGVKVANVALGGRIGVHEARATWTSALDAALVTPRTPAGVTSR